MIKARILLTVITATVALTLIGTTVVTAGQAEMDRSQLRCWVQERDRAVTDYLTLWLKGESTNDLVGLGMSIIVKDLCIISLCGMDDKAIHKYSILYEKNFDLQTLPFVLLEGRGVSFDLRRLFSGKTFRLIEG